MRLMLSLLASMLLFPQYTLQGQEHVHTPGMVHPGAPAAVATEGGQAAFVAIAEIVKLLEADPTTDWTKVNIERLRRHLLDMDLVTLRSRNTATPIAGGVRFDVRGTGETIGAIQRMTGAHATMVAGAGGPRITRTVLPDGVRLVVLSPTPENAASVARLRGLGFIGLMAVGDHHTAHHLALARGAAMADHGH